MSDDVDRQLRDQAWHRMCPDITADEITALEALPEAGGGHTAPARLLAAYRAGHRAAWAPQHAVGAIRGLRPARVYLMPGERVGFHGGDLIEWDGQRFRQVPPSSRRDPDAIPPSGAGLALDDYVRVRMPDGTCVVGKVKYVAGHYDHGSITVQAGADGQPIPVPADGPASAVAVLSARMAADHAEVPDDPQP